MFDDLSANRGLCVFGSDGCFGWICWFVLACIDLVVNGVGVVYCMHSCAYSFWFGYILGYR